MTVYIKGMKMPKDCTECTLSYLDKFGYPHCCITKLVISYGKTKDDCPLVYIPEPHGRLLDEGSLMKYFNVYKYEEWTSEEVSGLINNAPTIIEGSE